MYRFILTVSIAMFAVVWAPSVADARSHRVDDLPNGSRFGCLNCHTSSSGRGFNAFGISATTALVGPGGASEQQADWSQLYDRDSDADGFTNGEELGDPEGLWTPGSPDPSAILYNPGDQDSHPAAFCGDGRITPPEECEGDNLFNRSCEVLGLEPGVLSCTPNCRFDTSMCGGSTAMEGGDDVTSDMSMMESDDNDGGGGGCQQLPNRDSSPTWPWSGLALGLMLVVRRFR